MQPERLLTPAQQHRAHLIAAMSPRAIRRRLLDAERAALFAQRRPSHPQPTEHRDAD